MKHWHIINNDLDVESDNKLVLARTVIMLVLFVSLLVVFFFILYDVQYVHGIEHLDSSSHSVIRTETVDTVRGKILDSAGRVMVSNKSSYQISLDPSLASSTEEWYATLASLLTIFRDQGAQWSDSLPITASKPFAYSLENTSYNAFSRLHLISEKLDLDVEWESILIPNGTTHTSAEDLTISENWSPVSTATEFLAALDDHYKLSALLPGLSPKETRALLGILYELDLRAQEITYTEYIFASDVDITLITRIKEARLTGVKIDMVASRSYETPYAAHILGHVSSITKQQWEGTETTTGYRDLEGYSYNDKVGQFGVELAFEPFLHGISGVRSIETDSSGKLVTESWTTQAQPGSNVSLTIDLNLQAAVEEALARHIEGLEEPSGGAAVLVDMQGGVLSMASYPSFDLSSYSASISELGSDPLKPLYNRATQGTYMPGSIFKMTTALAALEEDIIEPNTRIHTTGFFTGYTSDPELAPKCWIYRQWGGSHGLINVSGAIENSCNVFFYDMGYRLGITTLGKYASMLGLGQSTGIEITERTGYVAGPETSEKLGVKWYAGATTSAAIGQENNLFTPLQLANYVATLVNGGTHYEAHLLNNVRSSDYSETLYEYEPTVLNQLDIAPENLDAIKQGMYAVTQSSNVKQYFDALPFKAGAKTGTAQINNNTSTNATFVCFAPYDDPQVALCLVVENGSSGSSLASLAAELLQFYFSNADAHSVISGENELSQ